MPLDIATLPEPLRLTQLSELTFEAPTTSYLGERLVIYGGALLAQSIAAVGFVAEDEKEMETIQLMLVRPGDATKPVEYEVERLATGRTISTWMVTATQRDRILSRALLLQSADEPDFLRHMSKPVPEVAPPTQTDRAEVGLMFPGATSEAADNYGVDIDPRNAHPAFRSIWMRYADPASPLVSQAILGWASFGVLGPLNISHHEGISTSDAHRTIMSAILTHTVHFLDPLDLDRSVLLVLEGSWAGRGRMHGQGSVFDRNKKLVATFANDVLFKRFADGRDHSAETKTIL
jgi:acyl-CoA thioesterase